MNVSMNIGMKNNILNVHHINNRGLSQKQSIIKNSELQELKDTVSISLSGKTKSITESLLKQKQKIIESKSELIGRTLEEGGDVDSIKVQLESFEEQIKNIDQQIAQKIAEQVKKQTEDQKEIAYKRPKTEEEGQTDRLNSIVNLSLSLSQAQVVSAVKTKMDGKSRVLEMEIKLDESRGGVSTSKKERFADLQKHSVNLTAQINENVIKVNEEIKDNSDNQLAESKNPKTTKDNKVNTEIEQRTEPNIIDNTVAKANKENRT